MEHAQPAIAAVALSQLALLAEAGIEGDMAAGHSFGEIMALHYGGSMNGTAALTAAVERGALMADAAKSSSGSMMAVQTSSDSIREILSRFEPELVLANDNGPSQVVLSGPSNIVSAAIEACTQRGLKARLLPVATAFHSKIVASAVAPFEAALKKLRLRKPARAVYANASAAPYACTAVQMASEIANQLASPVRFREMVEQMYDDGARIFIEIGPGSVITGLVDDVLGDRPHKAYALDNKRANGVTQFLSTLGALSVAGLSIDYAALFQDLPAEPPRPAPPKHAVEISGANYGKPYPPPDGAIGRAPPNSNIPNIAPDSIQPSQHIPKPSPQPSSAPSLQEKIMPDSSYSSFPSMPSYEPSGSDGETAAERIVMEVSRRHSDFLNMASAAHAAYLNTVAQVMGGAGVHTSAVKPLPRPTPPPAPAPEVAAVAPVPAAASVAPRATPKPSPQPAVATAPLEHTAVAEAPKTALPRASTVTPSPAPAPVSMDAIALVRGIIADKTGYPEDMLDAEMDLEGELGVDSIKQVEILSTLREQLPELPEIDPERLVELRTIAAIADMVSGATSSPKVATPAAKTTQAAAPQPKAPAPEKSGAITADVVRSLIAEKTGYPEDMLEDDMDLEGELGVDSIKQVEILSALREQHSGLPEVDPEALVELRTIRAIADFFA
ncbi:MAG: acyltransferase domain-containing protein [Hyphomonas sp.]